MADGTDDHKRVVSLPGYTIRWCLDGPQSINIGYIRVQLWRNLSLYGSYIVQRNMSLRAWIAHINIWYSLTVAWRKQIWHHEITLWCTSSRYFRSILKTCSSTRRWLDPCAENFGFISFSSVLKSSGVSSCPTRRVWNSSIWSSCKHTTDVCEISQERYNNNLVLQARCERLITQAYIQCLSIPHRNWWQTW